jgi:Ca-activated chloride channel family protein
MRSKLIFSILLCYLGFAFGDEIQEHVEVQLVQVDVTARNSKGEYIRDLTANDFVLKEDGKVQTVTHFYNSANDQTRYPLTVSFLIDTSFSMHERVAGMTRIDVAVKAAELVMDQLKKGDLVEVVEFDNEPREVVPFTSELNSVREKFEYIDFREANTAMNDSILFSLKKIHEQSGRKIMVIFSDGMDSASKSVQEDVVDAIHKNDATIVSFYSDVASLNFRGGATQMTGTSPQNGVIVRAGEDALRQYSEVSGGEFFSFRKEPELLKAMENLRNLVQSQYTLAYTPVAHDKKSKFRKIKVECKRKDVKLTFREGYFS